MEDKEPISLFPNPVKKAIKISVLVSLINSDAVLSDASGVAVQKIRITNTTFLINMQSTPTGIYFIRFGNGVVQKIVKE